MGAMQSTQPEVSAADQKPAMTPQFEADGDEPEPEPEHRPEVEPAVKPDQEEPDHRGKLGP